MTQGQFDAFYLPPGLDRSVEANVHRFGPPHDAIELRLASATPSSLNEWIESIRNARSEHLLNRPAWEIHRVLERVAERFLDPRAPVRENAVVWLTRAGRFSRPMVERALDDTFAPLARGGIGRWVQSELGSAAVLDRPMPDRSGLLRGATGPDWMLQIYAGNVPGLPVWPFYSALAIKSALLAKTSSQEPILAPLLARAIAEEDEGLGACMAVVWWKGGSEELDRAAIEAAPAVLAFGGETAAGSISRTARPDSAVVVHGPKVSVGYVSRGALTKAGLGQVAARAAYDIALYDQQGCLSPHAIYVERDGEVGPAAFATSLASALESLRDGLPRATPTPESAARIQLYRAQARFDEATEERATRVLGSTQGTDWTLVYEDGARFEPSPEYRCVRVHGVGGVEEVAAALAPCTRYLEAIGLEAKGKTRQQLTAALASLGVPRIAPLGSLQRPTPVGTHGGLKRLVPFLRWTTIEERPVVISASRHPSRGARKPRRGASRSR